MTYDHINTPKPAKASDPMIVALFDRLPKAGTDWAMEDRAKWLAALNSAFDLIYLDRGPIP